MTQAKEKITNGMALLRKIFLRQQINCERI